MTTEGSQVLFGTPPVYVSSLPTLFNHYSIESTSNVLLALKDHEVDTPTALYKFSSVPKKGEKEALTSFVSFPFRGNQPLSHNDFQMLHNRLPTSLELDTDTFQEVMNAAHKPLVVIVAAPASELDQAAKTVQEISTQWKDNKAEGNVVFTWMDADKWSTWLKNMYGIKGDLPRVVLSDHSVSSSLII